MKIDELINNLIDSEQDVSTEEIIDPLIAYLLPRLNDSSNINHKLNIIKQVSVLLKLRIASNFSDQKAFVDFVEL